MPARPDPSRLLSRRESAEFLGCSLDTIKRSIEDGSLRAYRLRGKVLIDPDDLRRLLVPYRKAGQR